MEIKIVGTLVLLEFPWETPFDIHTTFGVLIENKVTPLSALIADKLDRMDFDAKMDWIKSKKSSRPMHLTIDDESIDAFPYIRFSMSGWEVNDESAQEHDSGVEIHDEFQKPIDPKGKQKENFFDKMQKYAGKTVTITIK